MIHLVITTCGEAETIGLSKYVIEHAPEEFYKFWILKDSTKPDESYSEIDDQVPSEFNFIRHPMDGDFSKFRNSVHEVVDEGDYVLQLDADEKPHSKLLKAIPYLVEANPNVDLYYLPRENFVYGMTEEYMQKMGWRKDEEGRINYPDPQGRLYRYRSGIRWEGKVHEKIAGHKEYTFVSHDWAHLIHRKTFERQQKQNELYDEITK